MLLLLLLLIIPLFLRLMLHDLHDLRLDDSGNKGATDAVAARQGECMSILASVAGRAAKSAMA
jgi:hypothetical protein